MSAQSVIAVSKKFVGEVKKKFPVERAYLFGSFATGMEDEASDIDICIVSPAFGNNYLQEEMALIDLSIKVDIRLSPVAFNPIDINDRWSQLAHEITTHGIVL